MWQPQASAGTPSTVSIGRGKAPRWSRLQRDAVEQAGRPGPGCRSGAAARRTPGSARAATPPTSDDEHAAAAQAVQAGAEPVDDAEGAERAARPRVAYSKRASVTTGSKPIVASAPMRGDQHGDHAPRGRRARTARAGTVAITAEHGGDDAGHHRGAGAQAVAGRAAAPRRPAPAPGRRRPPAGRRCAPPAPRSTP